MKIPHSPRYCKSRFFAEREALANVTTREGTQGAKAPLQSGYFKRGMLNKLLSEGKKMRKIIAILLLLVCLLTAIFMVGCEKKADPNGGNGTAAFSGSVSEAFDLMKAAGTIDFTASTSSYGTFFTSVTYDGVTINNDNANGKYIGVFINTDDINLIDLYGTCDSVTYGGETFNYSGVGVDAIPYTAGLKVLIAFTVDVGNWHYTAVSGSALLFTLPDAAEKITLN